MGNKKSFFYFPTWTLIVISISFMLAALFNIVLFFNLESFKTVTMTVDGSVIKPGTQEYEAGVTTIKQMLATTAVFAILVSAVSGYKFSKRRKTNK